MIFATSDRALATCFITHLKNLKCGKFNDIAYIAVSKEEFLEHDKGGSLYELPSDTFESDNKKGMGEIEWISKVVVKPIAKQDYESSLTAMLEAGVQVYFVDEATLAEIKSAPDYGLSMFKKLESENQRTGTNIYTFA